MELVVDVCGGDMHGANIPSSLRYAGRGCVVDDLKYLLVPCGGAVDIGDGRRRLVSGSQSEAINYGGLSTKAGVFVTLELPVLC